MIKRDFYIGNTHVMIDDEYCVKTNEEIEEILRRIARIAYINANSKAGDKGETTCR